MDQAKIDAFKKREIKAKALFQIRLVKKDVALSFVERYHYLGDAKFFAKFSYGLYCEDELVGVASFSNPQGNAALKGWFSLPNADQSVLELSRLCLLPLLNGSNATSYLLGNACRLLRKEHGVRGVITLADNSRHVGSIYQVCNFAYYGLTDVKQDFIRHDGAVNPRGPTKEVRGVWVPRTRKHRYALILDPSLHCNYAEAPAPTKSAYEEVEGCLCDADLVGGLVFDRRFSEWHPCPACGTKD